MTLNRGLQLLWFRETAEPLEFRAGSGSAVEALRPAAEHGSQIAFDRVEESSEMALIDRAG